MKNCFTEKRFTLIDLVIIIAVIAILSAVLIPTFSNVINNAKESAAMQETLKESAAMQETLKESAAMQEANNAYKNWLAENVTKDSVDETGNICIEYKNYYFHVTNGKFENATESHSDNGTPLVLEVGADGKLQIKQ